MILEWSADSYVDGIGQAFVPQPEPTAGLAGSGADYALVYDPWTLLWTQYAGAAAEVLPADSGFQLIYDGWTFVWVQYGLAFPSWRSDGKTSCRFLAPTLTEGTFSAAGTGACSFQFEAFTGPVFTAHATGSNTWVGYSDIASGFRADGRTSCNFFLADASLLVRMDGKAKASFEGISVETQGFEAHATGGARFLAQLGASEECLMPPKPGEPPLPNFVF